MEKITTSQNRKQGLKAPKTHFVEESAFEAHFGRKAYDEELVVEEFNGTRMRGVAWRYQSSSFQLSTFHLFALFGCWGIQVLSN